MFICIWYLKIIFWLWSMSYAFLRKYMHSMCQEVKILHLNYCICDFTIWVLASEYTPLAHDCSFKRLGLIQWELRLCTFCVSLLWICMCILSNAYYILQCQVLQQNNIERRLRNTYLIHSKSDLQRQRINLYCVALVK